MLACFLIPWAAAIAYNAWERRGEILNWINARRLIPQRARPELDTLKARA